MPPKGWRKNPEGSHPVSSKERDMISIDDILFPRATVNRLAKAILADGGLISKDSSIALQRSATVFVSHLLVFARQHAKKFDRKTVGPQDIINALEEAEFSSFIPTVEDELARFQQHKDALKLKKREQKLAAAVVAENTTISRAASATPIETSTGSTIPNQPESANTQIEEPLTVEETEDENDSVETVDNGDTQPEVEPQPKKVKTSSREATVSETDS